ncbi:terminase small subunit [Salmonella enterica]|nr:terminase small subunit [Salmonella enterica]EHV2087151.1 terminase small subunit [Salmonella enterica]EHV2094484.1 terminase small subunit [Salmonella enterica]EIR7537134.1 terminase small subunit [Salmonella enterica subsp. enterica serovar Durham]EIR7541342.1 terminase small subunit [Salmonella enterica subsp. enterica serovar Durham]
MSKPEDGGLERDYCAGQQSLRKLAERYGISEGAIRKRAVKNGWVRSEKTGTQNGTQVRKKGTQKKEVRTKEKSPEEKKSSARKSEEKVFTDDENIKEEANDFGLSPQQALFAEYVAAGKSRIEAYRLAGYQAEGNAAYVTASQLLRNPKVARYVRHLRDKFEQRQAATIDDLIHQYTAIANADPNELAQHRRVNCRYCWGEHHLYQWRDIAEHDRAAAKAAKDGRQPPEYGGLGFVDTADPHPDCPKCSGEGVSEVFITDTRDLEGNARWLYAGVKETKFGIEVQTASQDAARRELTRLLTARIGSGGIVPGVQPATGYTADDYRKAQDWINNELGDLD